MNCQRCGTMDESVVRIGTIAGNGELLHPDWRRCIAALKAALAESQAQAAATIKWSKAFHFQAHSGSPDDRWENCPSPPCTYGSAGRALLVELEALRKVAVAACKSCACGARGEAPRSHPHVSGCELGTALAALDKQGGGR